MKLQNYLLLFITLFSFSVNSQNNNIPKKVKKTFHYSFENVSSESQIQKLKDDVYALKGVTEVSSEYDTERAKGQIIVVVIEREPVNEGDQEFDILLLKRAIIERHLTPYELTQESTTFQN